MTASVLDSTGGVLTGDFAKFVAEEQKAEAFTLKQQRLFAEEEEKRKSQKLAASLDPEGGGGGNRSNLDSSDRPPQCGPERLFPLRLRGWQSRGGEVKRRYLARRWSKREQIEAYVARAVRALNALADARADGEVHPVAPSRAEPA